MNFEELKLKPELHKAIKKLGFNQATDIQEKCIPVIFSGKDIVGQSKTGSGKTAAFGLPILNNITIDNGVQALILTPTRELCVQVYDNFKLLGQFMNVNIVSVYGGVSINPQINDLKNADIVIGTPGRVIDHLERKTLNLDKIKYFVLDEADRMLEMGFIDNIKHILKSIPDNKQSLMFSATMPFEIKKIVQKYFKNPVFISSQMHVGNEYLKQIYYNINTDEKFSLLLHLLREKKGVSLIFCATRNEVDIVTENLRKNNINAVAIHGGLNQGKRLKVVDLIKKEHVKVLVATDVAARGLDIRNIEYVFNYDLPRTSEEYIHRIGRTARMGDKGEAITLLTPNDYNNFSRILSNRNIKIVKAEKPKLMPVKMLRERAFKDKMFKNNVFRENPTNNAHNFSRKKIFLKNYVNQTIRDREERRARRKRD
ncbi:MAG: DEAD/DEAH box helicase [Candidatus Woesearchaeota archaeon]